MIIQIYSWGEKYLKWMSEYIRFGKSHEYLSEWIYLSINIRIYLNIRIFATHWFILHIVKKKNFKSRGYSGLNQSHDRVQFVCKLITLNHSSQSKRPQKSCCTRNDLVNDIRKEVKDRESWWKREPSPHHPHHHTM